MIEKKKKSWLILYITFSVIISFSSPSLLAEMIREPSVAGYFYPKDQETLRKTVDDFIANIQEKQTDGKILGLISPHAGYIFSGQTAAYSYKEIKGQHYDTVIILGPSHRVYIKGASVGNWDAYSTPLGKVAVNKEIVHALLDKEEDFRFIQEAHNREHSIEVQLPFLQRVLGNFDIVPILTGDSSLKDCQRISDILFEAVKNRNVLFVASSDMSHYPDYINANRVDKKTLSLIERGDPESVLNSEAEILDQGVPNLSTTLCGLRAVVTVMMTVKKLGGNFSKILHYANSGDISIDGNQERRKVVGYGAVAFYRK